MFDGCVCSEILYYMKTKTNSILGEGEKQRSTTFFGPMFSLKPNQTHILKL